MPEKKKHSIQSEAYEYIKKKIMMCEYLPNQLLSESILQEELGCSRTPVREAIRRLEQEGLATVLPKRGIVTGCISRKIGAVWWKTDRRLGVLTFFKQALVFNKSLTHFI